MDADDFARMTVYRRAYGLAKARLDRGMGVDGRDHRAALDRLVRDVSAERGDSAGQTLDQIRQGVEDAVEGRRPAW